MKAFSRTFRLSWKSFVFGVLMMAMAFCLPHMTTYAGVGDYYSAKQIGMKAIQGKPGYRVKSIKGNKIKYQKYRMGRDKKNYDIVVYRPYGKVYTAKLTKKTQYYVGDLGKFFAEQEKAGSYSKKKQLKLRWILRVTRSDIGMITEYGKKTVGYTGDTGKLYDSYSQPVATVYDYISVKNGKVKKLAIGLQVAG